MIKNRDNSEHYYWGVKCSGWHLVKSKNLSIIEESIPPETTEQRHYHDHSEQYFHILKGKARFEIQNVIINVEMGSGVHIPAKAIHCISNETTDTLEFLVISCPSTSDDRHLEIPKHRDGINLNEKYFKSESSSKNGEVDEGTIFQYRQKRDIVWATYEGGNILFGTLSGGIKDKTMEFTYQHQNLEGEFMTGNCKTNIEVIDNKIRLIESWQWTCKDYSKGNSILIEI